MADVLGTDSFLGWELQQPVEVLSGGYPNGGGVVPTTPPLVSTGGESWGDWFDRIVGGAVAVRNAWGSNDANKTTYPTSGGVPVAVGTQGQYAVAVQSALPWLLIAGVALAGFMLIRKL